MHFNFFGCKFYTFQSSSSSIENRKYSRVDLKKKEKEKERVIKVVKMTKSEFLTEILHIFITVYSILSRLFESTFTEIKFHQNTNRIIVLHAL